MKIKIGERHWLNSDAFCYWITCEYEIREGGNAGKTAERRVSGYVPTFERAVNSFIERHIKSAKIGDFTELVKTVNEIKAEVMSWKVSLERGETE